MHLLNALQFSYNSLLLHILFLSLILSSNSIQGHPIWDDVYHHECFVNCTPYIHLEYIAVKPKLLRCGTIHLLSCNIVGILFTNYTYCPEWMGVRRSPNDPMLWCEFDNHHYANGTVKQV